MGRFSSILGLGYSQRSGLVVVDYLGTPALCSGAPCRDRLMESGCIL